MDERKEIVIKVDMDSMSKVLGVKAENLMDKVITPVLNAGLDGMTYSEKLLYMIENHDILPNELAYIGIWGIEAIIKEITNRMGTTAEYECGDCDCK